MNAEIMSFRSKLVVHLAATACSFTAVYLIEHRVSSGCDDAAALRYCRGRYCYCFLFQSTLITYTAASYVTILICVIAICWLC